MRAPKIIQHKQLLGHKAAQPCRSPSAVHRASLDLADEPGEWKLQLTKPQDSAWLTLGTQLLRAVHRPETMYVGRLPTLQRWTHALDLVGA